MDAVAGVSIGFMVVPQGMSYALLAGLPAVYGLYGALVPVFVYAVFWLVAAPRRGSGRGDIAAAWQLADSNVPPVCPRLLWSCQPHMCR